MNCQILTGDCREVLKTLPDESVQMCVTSPPYWGLRDYGHEKQLGNEPTYPEYVANMVEVFSEVHRVLRPDGTLWLNLGDCYATGAGSARSPGGKCFGKQNESVDAGAFPSSQANRMPQPGLKPKDLAGIPWRVALALQAAGWWLRQDIIWAKPNPMPESIEDRCTKSHEYIFLLSKSERYFYDADAIKEAGKMLPSGNTQHKYINGDQAHRSKAGFMEMRDKIYERINKRSVWTVPSAPYADAHFATYPPDLIKPCILAGSKPGDVVLDPFGGSGTTGMVALELGRKAVLIELNPEYAELIDKRTDVTPGLAL